MSSASSQQGKGYGGGSGPGPGTGGQGPGSSGPGGGTGGPGPGAAPPPPFERIVDELTECSRDVINRVSERAKHNLKLAREQKYDVNAWLEDVKWFWSGVATDSQRLVEALRRKPDQQ